MFSYADKGFAFRFISPRDNAIGIARVPCFGFGFFPFHITVPFTEHTTAIGLAVQSQSQADIHAFLIMRPPILIIKFHTKFFRCCFRHLHNQFMLLIRTVQQRCRECGKPVVCRIFCRIPQPHPVAERTADDRFLQHPFHTFFQRIGLINDQPIILFFRQLP